MTADILAYKKKFVGPPALREEIPTSRNSEWTAGWTSIAKMPGSTSTNMTTGG